MSLEQSRDVRLADLWRGRWHSRRVRSALRQQGDLLGIFLRGAFGFLNLSLRVQSGLTFRLFDLLPGGVGLLLCKFRLLFCFLEFLLHLFESLLLLDGGLACFCVFQLLAQFLRFLGRLSLSIMPHILGLGVRLFSGRQLVDLRPREVRVEAGRMMRDK